jgi:hypothetical protein
MPTEIETLEDAAFENDTFSVKVTFTDSNNEEFTPNDLTYTLSDKKGNIINELENIEISPSSSVYITFTGDDLSLINPTAKYEWRVLTVKGSYDDIVLGNNLSIAREFHFKVLGLIMLP